MPLANFATNGSNGRAVCGRARKPTSHRASQRSTTTRQIEVTEMRPLLWRRASLRVLAHDFFEHNGDEDRCGYLVGRESQAVSGSMGPQNSEVCCCGDAGGRYKRLVTVWARHGPYGLK